ncbi:MAG: CarD family transcriptional regulator [Patescibacteria group bacterium]|nr:CarD family transcriptional regulator [Patescibacteria group bacterium]
MTQYFSGFLNITSKILFLQQQKLRDPLCFFVIQENDNKKKIQYILKEIFPNTTILDLKDTDIRIISDMINRKQEAIILTTEQTYQSYYILSNTQLEEAKEIFSVGSSVSKAKIIHTLKNIDYSHEEHHTIMPGSFYAPAGNIVEIFPFPEESGNTPTIFRIEFFGDQIDTVYAHTPGDSNIQTIESLSLITKNFETGNLKLDKHRQKEQIQIISLVPTSLSVDIQLSTLPLGKEQEQEIRTGSVLSFHNYNELETRLIIESKDNHIFCYTLLENELKDFCQKHDIKNISIIPLSHKESVESFINISQNYIVYTDQEIFGFTKNTQQQPKKISLDFLSEIQPGDYVIHIEHGIGQFDGIHLHTIKNKKKEFLKILYAKGDSLMVPVDQVDRLAKYHVSPGKTVDLHLLGGKKWKAALEKAKKETEKIAKDLLEIYAKRKLSKGLPLPGKENWMEEFIEAFPYQETKDQQKEWDQIQKDLISNTSMDRILCGDVGFGKTEVAMRAAMQAALSGYQTAILAPISILAQQHYRNFVKRFAKFPIRIEILNKGQDTKTQKRIIEDIQNGEVHIVIGTHRILGKDIRFENLGLMIVDEEQKFGVEQKEQLKKKAENINILTLSATPIPRTLNFGMAGMKDLSLLTTPPSGRQSIHTDVKPFSEQILIDAIKREHSRGGQIYILYNKVRGMLQFQKQLDKQLQQQNIDATSIIAHGQMSPDQVEENIQSFIDKKADILIASTIIENGIDLPNANSIIICYAERFGLSQLHQLRGRVGRSHLQAYAYFLYHTENPTKEAEARLNAIMQYSSLGDGFQIATADLEIRGAGTILG